MHEALLYDKKEGARTDCKLCSFYCKIPEGKLGACNTRVNENGTLYALTYGKTTGLALDPIEKKPLYHFHPGSHVLSFGTPGCNFKCLHCQNYSLSQSPREAKNAFDLPDTLPVDIAKTAAEDARVDGVAYTYNEPAIFFEYARDTVLETRKLAKEKYHVFVSNGYFSRECWDLIARERLADAINIDLKAFTDDFYKNVCGGASLDVVLENIKRVHASRVHLEVTYLVIPTKNDSKKEFKEAFDWIASVSCDIPVHLSRFYPMYKLDDVPPTAVETLLNAKEIARAAGLKYVYIGNVEVSGGGDTVCPNCGVVVVSRRGYSVSNHLQDKGCANCGERIAGVF